MIEYRTLYRITHRRYADEPFSGKGGLHYRSRWASKGKLVSYGSGHLATATLEKIAGVTRADLLTEMVYVKAKVPASHIDVLPDEKLPEKWDALPPSEATRRVGNRWLDAGDNLLLRIPAVVLPDCYNYVINAAHPDTEALDVVKTDSRFLDGRVLQRVSADQV